jgi:hypothetical protein
MVIMSGLTQKEKISKMNPNRIETIKHLASTHHPTYDGSWLGKDASKAFLICLGAGPWKEVRRYQVQKYALDWYDLEGYKDLYDIGKLHGATNIPANLYPFEWQNNHLTNTVRHLISLDKTFRSLCDLYHSYKWEVVLNDLFATAGVKSKGTKVLWMFARDFLNVPAFPIDRWVSRKLKEHDLPNDSWKMTELCLEAGVNPNELNRALFPGKNPDWSCII